MRGCGTEDEDTAKPVLGGHHPLQVSAKAAAYGSHQVYQAGAAGHAGVLSVAPLLVSAATGGLLTWDGFGHSQRSFAPRRAGKQMELSSHSYEAYHLSGTFSSRSQIYRHKSNENRTENGEKQKLLNS